MHQFKFWHSIYLHRAKVICFLCCILGFSMVAEAQANMQKHDRRKIHFGMQFGFTRNSFGITRSDAFVYHDSIKVVDSPRTTGFNVGIISDLHIGKHTDLRFIPTLVFNERKLRFTEIANDGDVVVNQTIESIILGFPLYFKYKSDRFPDSNGNFRFYFLGGGRLDWDLASNSKKRLATDIIKINNIDVLAEFGFGLEFYFPYFIFSPEIKISHGLMDLHAPTDNFQYSEVLNTLRSRYLTISFQIEG